MEEILVEHSTHANNGALRRRLIAEGFMAARCELCRISRWGAHPVPLELDHINGVHSDNRLENLRIVCPNCHALMETNCNSRAQPA